MDKKIKLYLIEEISVAIMEIKWYIVKRLKLSVGTLENMYDWEDFHIYLKLF